MLLNFAPMTDFEVLSTQLWLAAQRCRKRIGRTDYAVHNIDIEVPFSKFSRTVYFGIEK